MQDDAVQANDRQLKALTLRKAGAGYWAIAEALGYKDHSGAWRAVKAALKKTLQEPADELRQLELARMYKGQKLRGEGEIDSAAQSNVQTEGASPISPLLTHETLT